MKNRKFLVFIFLLLICLTGCTTKHRGPRQISLFGEELPEVGNGENNNTNNNNTNNNNNNNTEYNSNDLGDRSSYISWIGKYHLSKESEEFYAEMSIEAGTDVIIFNVTRNIFVYDNPGDEGYSIVSSYYFSTSLDNISSDEIIYYDEYSGLKFSISKNSGGINIEVLEDPSGEHKDMVGSYTRNNDSVSIKGYYSNSNGEIAITPFGNDYVKVSSKVLVDGEYYLYSQVYSVSKGTLKYEDGAGETAKIEKTSTGIKITSKIPGLAGEYEIEK